MKLKEQSRNAELPTSLPRRERCGAGAPGAAQRPFGRLAAIPEEDEDGDAHVATGAGNTTEADAPRGELDRIWQALVQQLGPLAAGSLLMRAADSLRPGAGGELSALATLHRVESIARTHRDWPDTLRRLLAEVLLPLLPALAGEYARAAVRSCAPEELQERLQQAASLEAEIQEWLATPVALLCMGALAGDYLRRAAGADAGEPASSRAGRLAASLSGWSVWAWRWFSSVSAMLARPAEPPPLPAAPEPRLARHLSVAHIADGAARYDSMRGACAAAAAPEDWVPVSHATERMGADGYFQCAADGWRQGRVRAGHFAGSAPANGTAPADPAPGMCNAPDMPAANRFVAEVLANWERDADCLQGMHVEILDTVAHDPHLARFHHDYPHLARFHSFLAQTLNAPGRAAGIGLSEQAWEHPLTAAQAQALLRTVAGPAQATDDEALARQVDAILRGSAAPTAGDGTPDRQQTPPASAAAPLARRRGVIRELNRFSVDAAPEPAASSADRPAALAMIPIVTALSLVGSAIYKLKGWLADDTRPEQVPRRDAAGASPLPGTKPVAEAAIDPLQTSTAADDTAQMPGDDPHAGQPAPATNADVSIGTSLDRATASSAQHARLRLSHSTVLEQLSIMVAQGALVDIVEEAPGKTVFRVEESETDRPEYVGIFGAPEFTDDLTKAMRSLIECPAGPAAPPEIDYRAAVEQGNGDAWAVRVTRGRMSRVNGARLKMIEDTSFVPLRLPDALESAVIAVTPYANDNCWLDISLLLTAGWRIQRVHNQGFTLKGAGRLFEFLFVPSTDGAGPVFEATVRRLMGGIGAQERQYRPQWEQREDNRAVRTDAPKLAVLSASDKDRVLYRLAGGDQHAPTDLLLSIGADALVGNASEVQYVTSRQDIEKKTLDAVSAFPDIVKLARDYMTGIFKGFGVDVDPAQVHLHTFLTGLKQKNEANREADGGFSHTPGSLRESTPLDRLAVNFLPFSTLDPRNANCGIGRPLGAQRACKEMMSGFYVAGPGAASYDRRNRLQHRGGARDGEMITIDDVYYAMKADPFEARAIAGMQQYFAQHADAETRRQRRTYAHYLLLEAGNMDQAAFALAFALLSDARASDATLRVETLDLYGYEMTDALRISRASGGPILHYRKPVGKAPAPAFHLYPDESSEKLAMIRLTSSAQGREQLLSRFGAGDRQDGPTMFGGTGVDTAVAGLSSFFANGLSDTPCGTYGGYWWNQEINDGSVPVYGRPQVNMKPADERLIPAAQDPFSRLVSLQEKKVLSDVEVLVVSADEFISRQWMQWMSGLSMAAGAGGLMYLPVIMLLPWALTAGTLASLSAPGIAAGIAQVATSDTREGKLEGWTLAVNSGLQFGFDIPFARLGEFLGLISAGEMQPVMLAARFGQEQIEALGAEIEMDLFPPAISPLEDQFSDQAVRHLLPAPQRLIEGNRAYAAKVKLLRDNFKVRASLIADSPLLDGAGRQAAMGNLLGIARKELDAIYRRDFLNLAVPAWIALDKLDEAAAAIIDGRIAQEQQRLWSLLDDSGMSGLQLQQERTDVQRGIAELVEDLAYPRVEWSDAQKREALAGFSDAGVVRPDAPPPATGVYPIGRHRYVFVRIGDEEMPVRVFMLRNGAREAVLQGSDGAAATGGDTPVVRRMEDGQWEVVERARLRGGEPQRPGSTAAHLMEGISTALKDGKEIYTVQVDGRAIAVGFDLDHYCWQELLQGKYPTQRRFFFDAQSRAWREHPADARFPRVTRAMKEEALECFGLPGKMPAVPRKSRFIWPSERKPVPHEIHQIWIGGAVPQDMLDNLEYTLKALHDPDAKFPFSINLHLDVFDPAARAGVMEKLEPMLKTYGAAFKVHPLRSGGFFQRFEASKFHEQYLAAVDSGSYAEAVDVLRFHLLDYYGGGIYKDMDDEMGRVALEGKRQLTIRQGDIWVMPPVSNPGLNMVAEYPTSIFATHEDNPLLRKLSEESYRRFKENPDVYKGKPADPDGRTRHMERVSKVGGPHMFSELISKEFPQLQSFRDWEKIRLRHIQIGPRKLARVQAAEQDFFPLDKHFHIKSAKSWAQLPELKKDMWMTLNGHAYVADPEATVEPMPADFMKNAVKARRNGPTYAYMGKNYLALDDDRILEVEVFPEGMRPVNGEQRGAALQRLLRTPDMRWETLPGINIQKGNDAYQADGAYLLQKMINDQNYLIDQQGIQSLRDSPEFRISDVQEIADKKVEAGDFVYRCDSRPEASVRSHGLRRLSAAVDEPDIVSADDLLAYAIRHSASMEGEGRMLSFSAKPDIPRLIRERFPDNTIYVVDTKNDRENWRSIADIILKDGMRLVKAKKLTKQTLYQAANNLKASSEMELFFFGNGGDIPADRIVRTLD